MDLRGDRLGFFLRVADPALVRHRHEANPGAVEWHGTVQSRGSPDLGANLQAVLIEDLRREFADARMQAPGAVQEEAEVIRHDPGAVEQVRQH